MKSAKTSQLNAIFSGDFVTKMGRVLFLSLFVGYLASYQTLEVFVKQDYKMEEKERFEKSEKENEKREKEESKEEFLIHHFALNIESNDLDNSKKHNSQLTQLYTKTHFLKVPTPPPELI